MLVVAVARYLHTVGVVAYDENDAPASSAVNQCFVGHMPTQPDRAVMLMPTGGGSQLTTNPTDLPTVQALVRGPKHDPRPALDLWQAVYDRLTCLDGTTLDPGGEHEVFVIGCTAIQSGPVPIGQDDLGRHEFTANYQFRIHAPTTHRPAVPA